jgi:hypothetical protein
LFAGEPAGGVLLELAECDAQPYSAQPANAERFTVSLDRAHSTGVESTSQTSSSPTLVISARVAVNQTIVAASFRSRLL